jgi:SAM-dependent methyltransferase
MKLKSAVGKTVRALAGQFGYQVVSKANWYIDCKSTVENARLLGLSVPAYVAQLWEDEGLVEEFVKYLSALIPLSTCSRILEIGTGTGRFLESVAQVAKPSSYDVFEASPEWSGYLASTFPYATVHAADGRTLSSVADASRDLVHAHGVFVYLPVSASFGYLHEMARVCAPGGFIAFDCFLADRQTLESIDNGRANGVDWQILLPREAICELFLRQGFAVVDDTYRKKTYLAGFSDYLVFQKTSIGG